MRVHGGNIFSVGGASSHPLSQWIDASASLAPFWPWREILGALRPRHFRFYPSIGHPRLRACASSLHGLPSEFVLIGNGAAELFTWAARDASSLGCSFAHFPGFADYTRALNCWTASYRLGKLPLSGMSSGAVSYPSAHAADVLWLCNPHNPTGHLWSRASLEPLLKRFRLVICDEAFLSLVPDGEQQSLIPLVAAHPNLVVIRSLTKLYGIAGLRLGYAVAQPERLQRWAQWRDPWPVNGIATAVAEQLLASPAKYQRWCRRAQSWVSTEGAWMQQQLAQLPGITPMPSAANFLLIQADQSLVPLREAVEQRHRILLRDCRSFEGLGECWLRIGLQSRRNNRRIIRALKQELDRAPLV